MRLRFLPWLLGAVIVALGYALYSGLIAVPDRWNPWAPLRIEDPLDWLTRFKLERTGRDPDRCLATLAQAGLRYESVADRVAANGCGLKNAVRVRAAGSAVSQPFVLSCPSALALAMWERHVVQPAARSHFGTDVKRLDHFGSYACRNIYGRKDAPLSRHATADALDVAGFLLSNGRRITIERDWGSDDPDGLFLRQVHDGACRIYDGVLGPDYNEAHRNHFHLERGGYRVCR
jgi:hypothetical protein